MGKKVKLGMGPRPKGTPYPAETKARERVEALERALQSEIESIAKRLLRRENWLKYGEYDGVGWDDLVASTQSTYLRWARFLLGIETEKDWEAARKLLEGK